HPAGPDCAASANAKYPDGTFPLAEGGTGACFPSGCTPESESDPNTRKCYQDTQCDFAVGTCVPNPLGEQTCEQALFDADDLDEGTARYFEQNAKVPHRLARHPDPAAPSTPHRVGPPPPQGAPFGPHRAWPPNPTRPHHPV